MPLNYATTFGNVLRELYGQELLSDDLYHSNEDIQIINTKDLKLPPLSVSGYKDHTRAAQFNSGTYQNDYQTALDYFYRTSRSGYNRAFKSFRIEFIRANFNWMLIIILVIIVGLVALSYVNKRRKKKKAASKGGTE